MWKFLGGVAILAETRPPMPVPGPLRVLVILDDQVGPVEHTIDVQEVGGDGDLHVDGGHYQIRGWAPTGYGNATDAWNDAEEIWREPVLTPHGRAFFEKAVQVLMNPHAGAWVRVDRAPGCRQHGIMAGVVDSPATVIVVVKDGRVSSSDTCHWREWRQFVLEGAVAFQADVERAREALAAFAERE